MLGGPQNENVLEMLITMRTRALDMQAREASARRLPVFTINV